MSPAVLVFPRLLLFGSLGPTMRLGLIFLAKFICQIGLFVFFLCFFGIPCIKRYQQEEVIVVSATRHSGGILAPTISVVARNSYPRKGWKSDNITSSVEVIKDQCGDAGDIKKCIIEGTYSLSDMIKHAHIGYETNESLMNESLWQEDFTNTFYGRYYTLNLDRRVTPNYRVDQIFLHLQRNLNFTIFIYNRDFFVLNKNILSFPIVIQDVSSSMGNYFWNLAVTERFELNHPKDPCYEGNYFAMKVVFFPPINSEPIKSRLA